MEPVRARELSRGLLAEALPRRWSHTEGVAQQAETIGWIVGEDAGLLVAAAWLHDIGYAPTLAATGFHPLDGARYLRDVARADERLCRMVAHHTCAVIEARRRGLLTELTGEFASVDGLVMDALTYCDMTTSPEGARVDVSTRLAEIISRYGHGALVAESIKEARPRIEESARVVLAAVAA